MDDCLGFSAFSEDQAISAYLAAAANIDESSEPYDPRGDVVLYSVSYAIDGLIEEVEPKQAALVREIIGNPFRPVAIDPSWLSSTAFALAQGIYDDKAFDRLPILADALQDAGCENADLLNHLRSEGPHVKGCWVLDLILGKS